MVGRKKGLARELMDFNYREKDVSSHELFPKFDKFKVDEIFGSMIDENPHATITNVADYLARKGYREFLDQFGFWEEENKEFKCHCHQTSPVLGVILSRLGLNVSYLEGYRIREHFIDSGKIEKVPPQEEPNPKMLEEFCEIERIPYCCLEIERYRHISPKHLKLNGEGKLVAGLTPVCYRDFSHDEDGVLRHQDNKRKSGIYLARVLPNQNPDRINFDKQLVWQKQTPNDPNPELFATFLRMNIVA